MMTVAAAGTAAADGAPSAPTDAAFATAVHQGNLFEITAGLDAERDGSSQCVRRTAEVLVRDHRKLDQDLTTLAAQLGIALPKATTPQMRRQLANVQAKAGKGGYDGAWLTLQTAAHKSTLKLLDAKTGTGGNTRVVAAARAARPVVASHLSMLRDCQARVLGAVKAGAGSTVSDDGTWPAARAAIAAGGTGLAAAGATWLVRRRRHVNRPG
jgi:putative membrane protein